MGVFLGNSPFYIGSGIFRIIYAHQCMKNKMKNLQPFVLYVLTGRRFIFAQSYHSLGKYLSYHTPQTFIAWKSFLLTFLVDKTSRDNNSEKKNKIDIAIVKGCKSPFQKHPTTSYSGRSRSELRCGSPVSCGTASGPSNCGASTQRRS